LYPFPQKRNAPSKVKLQKKKVQKTKSDTVIDQTNHCVVKCKQGLKKAECQRKKIRNRLKEIQNFEPSTVSNEKLVRLISIAIPLPDAAFVGKRYHGGDPTTEFEGGMGSKTFRRFGEGFRSPDRYSCSINSSRGVMGVRWKRERMSKRRPRLRRTRGGSGLHAAKQLCRAIQ